MLTCWRDTTEQEYPEFVDLLPRTEDIDLVKSIDCSIMTDTCHSAQKYNRELSNHVNGKTHNLICRDHLRNIHVKNVLESLIILIILTREIQKVRIQKESCLQIKKYIDNRIDSST